MRCRTKEEKKKKENGQSKELKWERKMENKKKIITREKENETYWDMT
jgi:hypothetical protein